jgi:hypothetical protein
MVCKINNFAIHRIQFEYIIILLLLMEKQKYYKDFDIEFEYIKLKF